MVTQFLTAHSALRSSVENYNGSHSERPIELIMSRWQAEKEDHRLPAIIHCISKFDDSELLESLKALPPGEVFYLEVCVNVEEQLPAQAVTELISMISFCEEAFSTAGIPVVFLGREIGVMPFGKRTCLSMICSLYIGPQ